MEPAVVLSANVTHYRYTAKFLDSRKYLRLFICGIGFSNPGSIPSWFPGNFKTKAHGRDNSIFDEKKVRSLWVPELLQRGLPGLGLISSEHGNLLNSYLFDWMSSRYVLDGNIFHCINGIGLSSAKKAKQNGKMVICDTRTTHPIYQSHILRDEYRRLGIRSAIPGEMLLARSVAEYAYADYIIVPSNFVKSTYSQMGINTQKLHVLPYGVDTTIFYRKEDNKKKNQSLFRIIYVGQITPQKGILYLIEAFRRLDDPKMELILAGHVDASLKDLIEKHVLNDHRIRLTGYLIKNDLVNLYNQSSVFVLPSIADSFGLVFLEAMACGLPVIVTENTGGNEVIQEGENGFVIPIRDVALLAEKLAWYYDNPKQRTEMGCSAQERSKEFTWEKYGERLIQFYQQLSF